MDNSIRIIEHKIEQIKKKGHGEVVIKIKNGYIWRILTTEDDFYESLDKKVKVC